MISDEEITCIHLVFWGNDLHSGNPPTGPPVTAEEQVKINKMIRPLLLKTGLALLSTPTSLESIGALPCHSAHPLVLGTKVQQQPTRGPDIISLIVISPSLAVTMTRLGELGLSPV